MQGVSSNAIKPYSKSSLKEHVFEVLLRAIRKAQGAPKGIDHERMRKKNRSNWNEADITEQAG
jgi:hypothetical protein